MSSSSRLSSSTTRMRALSICRAVSRHYLVKTVELARSFFHVFAGPLQRDAHPHRGALALPADDVDFSVEHGGPFPHAEQSERPGARNFAPGHAAPVVLHFEDQLVAFLSQVKVHLRCVGMADDISQGLLKDAEHGRRPVRAEIDVLQTARELALDAGAFFELLDLPFDR